MTQLCKGADRLAGLDTLDAIGAELFGVVPVAARPCAARTQLSDRERKPKASPSANMDRIARDSSGAGRARAPRRQKSPSAGV